MQSGSPWFKTLHARMSPSARQRAAIAVRAVIAFCVAATFVLGLWWMMNASVRNGGDAFDPAGRASAHIPGVPLGPTDLCLSMPEVLLPYMTSDTGDDFGLDGATKQGNLFITTDTLVLVYVTDEAGLNGDSTDKEIVSSHSIYDIENQDIQWTTATEVNSAWETDAVDDIEPAIASDGDDRWITVWSSGPEESEKDIYYAISEDLGESWTTATLLNSNGGIDTGDDRTPSISCDGDENWIVVWSSTEADIGGGIGTDKDILFSASTNNGDSWSAPALLNGNGASDAGTNDDDDITPRIVNDYTGNWIVVWESNVDLNDELGTDGDILYSVTENLGSDWSSPAPLNTNADSDEVRDGQPDVRYDLIGNLLCVWTTKLGEAEGDLDILHAQSDDGADSWTAPDYVNTYADGDTGDDLYPRLGINENDDTTWFVTWTSNQPVVEYSEFGTSISLGTDFDILGSLSSDGGETWYDPILVNKNGESDSGDDTRSLSALPAIWWQSDNTLPGSTGTDLDIHTSNLIPCSEFPTPTPTPTPLPFLYSVSPDDNLLRTVDPASGVTEDSIEMALTGQTIEGATGLAMNPETGELFVLLNLDGFEGNSRLAKVNPETGEVETVGSTGDFYNGIVFRTDDDVLIGSTASIAESNVPLTLYELDPDSGTASYRMQVYVDDLHTSGQAIAYHADEHRLYHSIGGLSGGSRLWEKVNLDAESRQEKDIPEFEEAVVEDEFSAMVYDSANGELFAATSGTPTLYRINPETSEVIDLHELDHVSKGLAYSNLVYSHGHAAPSIEISIPEDDALSGSNSIAVQGTVYGLSTSVWVDGNEATKVGTQFFVQVSLESGSNALEAYAENPYGNASDFVNVTYDDAAPAITFTTPATDPYTVSSGTGSITVEGTITDDSEITRVRINGRTVAPGNTFSKSIDLVTGPNVIRVKARDAAGLEGDSSITVVRSGLWVTIDSPLDEFSTTDASVDVSGNLGESGASVTVNGAAASVAGTEYSLEDVALAELGANSIIVVAEKDDIYATATITVNLVPAEPEPSVIDPTDGGNFQENNEFLYTGGDPVQTGVNPEDIISTRTTVLSGNVYWLRSDLEDSRESLGGVVVTISNHPEFGQTITRLDGSYDIVVNGGGPLALNFEKVGYVTAQRLLDTSWHDYLIAPGVILTRLDPVVTEIELDSEEPFQVARGSIVEDDDGVRQATVMIAEGTTASLRFTDGGTSATSVLHIRATEFSVGPNGPDRMPASLPPASGYTYCLDLTIDEAIQNEAASVDFGTTVPFYVENYLGFPVGTDVPTGYLDYQRSVWVPSPDGRVIEILDVIDDLAVLNLDTDPEADTDDVELMAALGITEAELATLATLSFTTTTLWRVPITHFTPYDCNWTLAPSGSDTTSDLTEGKTKSEQDGDPPCTKSGSIIEVDSQVLGESVPIAGTAFSLNYRSNRVPGRKSGMVMDIPLVEGLPPPGLQSVELSVNVGGAVYKESFSPSPDLAQTFSWAGEDKWGRTMSQSHSANVSIGYKYGLVDYKVPDEQWKAAFGVLSGKTYEFVDFNVRQRPTSIVYYQNYQKMLTTQQPSQHALGGWTFNVHHSYDPERGLLNLGDGTQRSIPNSVITGLGSAVGVTTGAGHGIDVGPDGAIYLAVYIPAAGSDDEEDVVYKIDPKDGSATLFAGGGDPVGPAPENNGDGGNATDANLESVTDVALGPDGSLYIAEFWQGRIRRVDPSGEISTFAGKNDSGDLGGGREPGEGDNGPATEAHLDYALALATDPSGNVYIVEELNAISGPARTTIRQVGPDNIIRTFVPPNHVDEGPLGDGGPFTDANYGRITDIAVGPDGSLYLAEEEKLFDHELHNGRIRHIGNDGIAYTVAGGVSRDFNDLGDGIPAVQADINPYTLVVDKDGTIYCSDLSKFDEEDGFLQRVRRIVPGGIITTVAGGRTSEAASDGDGGYAAAAAIADVSGLALSPGGLLYLNGLRLRAIQPGMPGFSGGDFQLPSEDGSLVYIFNANGRHLSTVDSLTGITLLEFGYDGEGRLETITDPRPEDDLVTSIDYVDEDTIQITAPFGQGTELTLGEDGYIQEITNPESESYTMDYHGEDGLLYTFTDPNEHTSTFQYDSEGRLLQDADAAGGYINLNKVVLGEDSQRVDVTTAMSRLDSYQIQRLANGDRRSLVTAASSGLLTILNRADGSYEHTAADGTTGSGISSPDPRFGMMAPISTASETRTPGNLTTSAGMTRDVDSPSSINFAGGVNQLTDITIINGREYLALFQRGEEDEHTLTITTPEGRNHVSGFDFATGRLVSQQSGSLLPALYFYDSFGRLDHVAQGDRTMSFDYDETSGYLQGITDSMDHEVTFTRDGTGRNLSTLLPGARTITMGYDDKGNIETLTPPDRPNHEFHHTEADLTSHYIPPNLDEVDTEETQYDYNYDKQLELTTRPDSLAINPTYDATTGLLIELDTPRGATSYQYDDAHQLHLVTAPEHSGGGVIKLEHDGSHIKSIEWRDGEAEAAEAIAAGKVEFTYTDDLALEEVGLTDNQVVPTSVTMAFDYDNDGLLENLSIEDQTMTISRDEPNGLITGAFAGDQRTTFTFNAFGELEASESSYNNTSLLKYDYARDGLGRIELTTETLITISHTFEYDYSVEGWLEEVRKDSMTNAQYTYDGNGNRLTGPETTDIYQYDDQDRLTSFYDNSEGTTWTYTYTDNGELASKNDGTSETVYTYDVLGQLLEVTLPDSTIIEYIIDGLNRRVGKKVNGTLVQGFLYGQGCLPIAELDGSGSIVSVFAGDIIWSKKEGIEFVAYAIVRDHLGSPRLIVRLSDGYIMQSLTYNEFGQVLTGGPFPYFQPFAFANGLYDYDTELTRFGARDYDSRLGRWTARDPIGFNGADTNLYAYSSSDPINRIDPYGLLYVDININPFGVLGGGVMIGDDGFHPYIQVGLGSPGGGVTLGTGDPGSSVSITASVFLTGSLGIGTTGPFGEVGFTAPGGSLMLNIDLTELIPAFGTGGPGITPLGHPYLYERGPGDMKNGPAIKFLEFVNEMALKQLAKLLFPEPACFVGGTLVWTAKGLTPIECIEIGDEVWTYDEDSQNAVLDSVSRIYVSDSKSLVRVSTNAGVITTTPDHPFWVKGYGWKAAGQLSPQDALVSLEGDHEAINSSIGPRVLSTVFSHAETRVYNIQVAKNHNYFVSNKHILVHNRCR